MHIALDRIGRHSQAGRDLAVGITQAGQGGNILRARAQRLPVPEKILFPVTLGQTGGEQVGMQIPGGTSFLTGEIDKRGAQGRVQLERARGWIRLWPQEGEQAIPD